ncbi:guanine nucleotide-binding protein subunit beta-like protein 1 [Lingula anatina]|uniref:Guanine nucleotide-binding protein subunit beta-like protein 1 n=1 Tax=Lingula anatina TaxID=7574 RepID=A0A1S3IJV7_LINAN|nr:guanine nucleotide-binding protein subunit beta-like protein 1 [Lingula anatina]XP_013398497.1 guanine nucleotide-binding protein subunit beta-like protein 1 [Lingula anatina]XP_013398498.1 guanine nucleotide-binding protein subunit beta-like protein 1 [Lingula anatina]|eukprot:XP_013398496.1 guanine nucleotide-binding protein subunit beta-like protein 1 [Lingula anatina]
MSRAAPDPSYILRGAHSEVTSLTFTHAAESRGTSPAGLISGTLTGAIQMWDWTTKRIIKTVEAHKGESLLWLANPGDGRLLSQGRDGRLVLWDCSGEDWRQLGWVPCAALGFCRASLLNKNPDILAVPSPALGEISVISIPSLQILHTMKVQKTQGMCMSLKLTTCQSEKDILLIGGFENGSLVLWQIGGHDVLHSLALHEESVMALDYNSKVNRGISGSVDTKIQVWTISEELKIQSVKEISITNAGVSSVTIREDGKIFITGGWDHQVRVFGMKKLNALAVLNYHSATINCTVFSKDNTIAAGSKDRLITVWDVYK